MASASSWSWVTNRVDRWDFSITANAHTTVAWERAYPCRYETLEVGYPRNDRQSAHRHGPDQRVDLHPDPAEAGMTRPLKTGIGVVLTAIMLFPVYWMINVSFTRDTDMRASPPHL